ncbi:MAG TPA: DUF1302 family protein [Polyangiaceae bacterium]
MKGRVAVKRSRHFLACSLVLIALGLRFAADVRAQPAPEAKPGTPVTQAPSVDAGAPDAVAPSTSAAPTPTPPETAPSADAGTPETAPAAPASPAAPATEEAPSTGSGLFEQSLGGAPPSEGAAASETGTPRNFDFGGYVRGDMFVGKFPGVKQPEVKAGYGELSLKLNVKKERYGDAFAEARIRYGLQDHEQKVILDLREAYVNAYLGPLDLRLGQQIIVWGRADAFNPTNNISAIDLRVHSPVEDDRRLGNVGLRAFLNFEPMRLEGVWMPLYVPTELPRGVVPDIVTFAQPDFPDTGLERSLGALRAHLELPSFETSVSYLYGYAPLPGFALSNVVTGPNPEVQVSRTAYNQHVVGFDFSTAIGDVFALRGEAAYRRPLHWEDKPYAPHPDLQYVIGADKTFDTVSVIAQYMGRYVFDWKLEPGSPRPLNENVLILAGPPPVPPLILDPILAGLDLELRKRNQILFSQRAKVQHLATLRIEWLTMHDTLSLSALGMMNFTSKESLLFPKLSYKMSDSLSTAIGAELYSGPEDTLFGLIEAELSAGYAELRYSF